jgi:hypothetical protein
MQTPRRFLAAVNENVAFRTSRQSPGDPNHHFSFNNVVRRTRREGLKVTGSSPRADSQGSTPELVLKVRQRPAK